MTVIPLPKLILSSGMWYNVVSVRVHQTPVRTTQGVFTQRPACQTVPVVPVAMSIPSTSNCIEPVQTYYYYYVY
jgi:hypothetical protein